MNLLASLGLDQTVAAGDLPPNKYDGVVDKSSLVYNESKDTISHVISYKVDGGDFNGQTKDEWFTFGNNPVDANGVHTTDPEQVASFTPTWSEQNRSFYKKRLIDLGVPEDVVNAGGVAPKDLEGIPVTFGVKERDGYKNINFAEKRVVQADAMPQGLNAQAAAPATQQAAQPAATPAPQVPQNLGGLV